MRAFRLAYDGEPFHGFQRQPDVPTVEDALFDALRALEVLEPDDDKPPEYAAAGRTDAGVSALGQVVAFEAPGWLTPAALNGELPADMRAWASAEAPTDFHATRDAAAREYAYYLCAPGADLERTREAAARFEGTHDFHNFSAASEATTRTVLETGVERDGNHLRVRVRGDGFVHEQVRRMVSVLGAVARGESEIERIETALSARKLDGPEGIAPAAAYPLLLVDVEYPDLEFTVDEGAAESARDVFAARRIERRTRAQVAEAITDGI
ncbi:MAG: tRNA pseudouridine(38-40) synthase TruA [Halobacteriales archaeon]